LKEQHNIKRIRVLGESTRSTANQNQTVVRCDKELQILHAAYLSVIILLVIIIVVVSVIHWRIRQDPGNLITCFTKIEINKVIVLSSRPIGVTLISSYLNELVVTYVYSGSLEKAP